MDDRVPPRGHENVIAVTEELFTGVITANAAAERIAALTLKSKPETGLSCTWASITLVAHNHPHELESLASLLISMANLPDAKTMEGNPLVVYDAKVWSDLPMLGWAINDEWNGYTIPDEEPRRSAVIQKFTNINTLTALLMRSGKTVFDYAIFAISTMEQALETPVEQAIRHPDAFIPAGAAWISFLGQEMYQWDTEFPHGDLEGDHGVGGPLWHGQHGPCKERWQLWRRRFEEISESGDFPQQARETARKAAEMMAEIEGR